MGVAICVASELLFFVCVVFTNTDSEGFSCGVLGSLREETFSEGSGICSRVFLSPSLFLVFCLSRTYRRSVPASISKRRPQGEAVGSPRSDCTNTTVLPIQPIVLQYYYTILCICRVGDFSNVSPSYHN